MPARFRNRSLEARGFTFPETTGASASYRRARITPMAADASVLSTPFSGCWNFPNSDPCIMLSTMIVPKMKGIGTRTMKETTSIFTTSMPSQKTSQPPASITIVHTKPSAGCFISAGNFVKGHRSKLSNRNMTLMAVT